MRFYNYFMRKVITLQLCGAVSFIEAATCASGGVFVNHFFVR